MMSSIKVMLAAMQFPSYAAKEVYSYALALRNGYEQVKKGGLLVNTNILEIQKTLEENSAGFRKLPGTVLKNDKTGEIVYSPPQDLSQINLLMDNLEKFINDDQSNDIDPLIKMAVIHHQFESIHPFYDGNGRTGRIINILYLVKEGLLISLFSTFPDILTKINISTINYFRLFVKIKHGRRGCFTFWMGLLKLLVKQSTSFIR